MALNAILKAVVSANLTGLVDIGAVEHVIDFSPNVALTEGTGPGQANNAFADSRSLAASATESLDLAGGLVNAIGATLNFTSIKAIVIRAAAANVNDVVVGGAGANAFFSAFGAATDVVKVRPGGVFMLAAPAGYAVTAATADLLKIANSAAGSVVNYDIIIIGVV